MVAPMSKLDELDKEFEKEFGWARSRPASEEWQSSDVNDIKSFARKYYEAGYEEGFVDGANKRKAAPNQIELARQEEREAARMSAAREIGLAASSEGYNGALTDLLNELK